MKIVYIAYPKESLLSGALSDLGTGLMLTWCILLSYKMDSSFWTVVSFGMYILYFYARIRIKPVTTTSFSTKKEALKWAETLPED